MERDCELHCTTEDPDQDEMSWKFFYDSSDGTSQAHRWTVADTPDQHGTVLRGFIRKNKAWTTKDTVHKETEEGVVLSIYFLDGEQRLRDETLKIAREWTVKGGANIRFQQVTEIEASDIRVTFDTTRNASAIGKDAKDKTYKNKASMFLANARLNTFKKPTKEMKYVVRHEFGHALGLSHEHQHPDAPFVWDEDAVLEDHLGLSWGGCDQGKDACLVSVRANITRRTKADDVAASSGYDANSIMMYPILKDWIKSGKVPKIKEKISPLDLLVASMLYP